MTVGSAPSAVGPVGLEPTTYGLKVRGSTIELQAHNECTACERLRRSGDCDLAVAFATHSVLRAMPASRGLQLRCAVSAWRVPASRQACCGAVMCRHQTDDPRLPRRLCLLPPLVDAIRFLWRAM